MEKNHIEELIRNYNDKYQLCDKNSDLYILDGIPDSKYNNAFKSHNLIEDEVIYLLVDTTFWGSASDSLLITNYRISIRVYGEENSIWFTLQELNSVSYNKLDELFSFKYSYYNTEILMPFADVYSVVSKDEHRIVFAELLTNIANDYEDIESFAFKQIFEQEDRANQKEKLLEYLEEFKEGYCTHEATYLLASLYSEENQYEKALGIITNLDLEKYDKDCHGYFHFLEAKVLLGIKQTKKAELKLLQAKNSIKDLPKDHKFFVDSLKDLAIDDTISTLQNIFCDDFDEIEPKLRKYILVTDTTDQVHNNSFYAFQMNTLPKIEFPTGHPQVNMLYVLHPQKKNLYIPTKDLDSHLIVDKLNEYQYFIQCLGARKIEIVRASESRFTSHDTSNQDTSVSIEGSKAGIKAVSFSGEYSRDITSNENILNTFSTKREQIFSPKKKPYLPDTLNWYNAEPSWQRLYEQRINGGLLSHTEILSTSTSEVVSESEKKKVSSDIALFVNKFKSIKDTDKYFENTKNETLQLEIKVEFEDIANLLEENQEVKEEKKTLSDIEATYKEDVEMMLEDDNIIDEAERKMLDRKKIKLGLSQERAKEIEMMVIADKAPMLKEELEYLEEYRAILEETPELSKLERRLLDRLARKSGITSERQKELEEGVSIG